MAVEYTHRGDDFVFENYIPRGESELFYIEAAGYTSPRSYYHIRRKASINSTVFVLEYVMDGKGYILYNGKKYTVNKGDFYMIDSTYTHEYFSDPETPLSKIWINVYGSYMEKITEAMEFEHVTVHTVDVQENIQEIHTMIKGKSAYEVKQMSEDLMVAVFQLLYKVYIDRKIKSEHDNRFSQIKNYVQDHITDGISVEKICNEFFISKSTLYRMFKNELDISPTEYIKNLKIHIACRILKATNIDINEIVRQLGFYDNSHFSRTFYSIKGMSPSAYRKSKQNPVKTK